MSPTVSLGGKKVERAALKENKNPINVFSVSILAVQCLCKENSSRSKIFTAVTRSRLLSVKRIYLEYKVSQSKPQHNYITPTQVFPLMLPD